MKNSFHKKDNRIAEILKQRDGATIVFALVVFMIAAVASATIVSVAMTNLKRTAGRRDYEQARLAVMSAAKYLESGDTALLAALEALPTGTTGPTWTVSVSNADANAALETTITWKDIDQGTSMTGVLSSGAEGSGKYTAQIRLVKDGSNWRISKFTKKTGS